VRVLVVDDGSVDGTAALVRARPETAVATVSGKPLLALLAVPHGGKGAAVKAGMLAAETDLAIFTDADMANPPDQLPLLVEALGENDVALGSRIQPDGSDMRRSQPRFRRLLGRAFHGLASVWAVGHVQDTQCGFKGFTREAAHDLFAQQKITSIVFDVELIYLAGGAATGSRSFQSSGRTSTDRACNRGCAWACGSGGTSSARRSSTGGSLATELIGRLRDQASTRHPARQGAIAGCAGRPSPGDPYRGVAAQREEPTMEHRRCSEHVVKVRLP